MDSIHLSDVIRRFLRSFGLKDLSSLPKTSEELMAVFNKAKIGEGITADDAALADSINDDSAQIEMEIDAPTSALEATEED